MYPICLQIDTSFVLNQSASSSQGLNNAWYSLSILRNVL